MSVGHSRPQLPSDADLVREARGGSKEAMAELLRRHWDTAVLLAGGSSVRLTWRAMPRRRPRSRR